MKNPNIINVKSNLSNYTVLFTKNFEVQLYKDTDKNDLFIIDKKIYKLYKLNSILKQKNIILVSANEKSKSFHYLGSIIKKINKISFTRSNKIIAIGGGITQDISSFISSILFRGVKWYFYPTSYLAQCDSCIGGKTSINFEKNKNQIGNFYPPVKIIIDNIFLKSLGDKELRSGIGEMAHYYFVSSQKDYVFFTKNFRKALNRNFKIAKKLIYRTLEIKKHYIEIDEFDKNERLILNYGHSFGHALEAATNYKIPHGIAVAHGMNMANFVSLNFKYIRNDDFSKMQNVLKEIWGNYLPIGVKSKNFIDLLRKDKKNNNKNLRLILTEGIGKMKIKEVKVTPRFKKIVEDYINHYFQ